MSGALMQIATQGPQDVVLTGTPSFSFFKTEHKQYTPFAIQSYKSNFNGSAAAGRQINAEINRVGDLIGKTYLVVQLPALTASTGTIAWTRKIGFAIIDKVELQIGGTVIDTRYGHSMYMMSELFNSTDKNNSLDILIGNTAALTTPAASIPSTEIRIPLDFYFTKSPGKFLPVVALSRHKVSINVSFTSPSNLTVVAGGATAPSSIVYENAVLEVDTVFLGETERAKFISVPHQYLIQQCQTNNTGTIPGSGGATADTNLKINFNQACSEFFFAIQPQQNITAGRYFDYTTGSSPYTGDDVLVKGGLRINNVDIVQTSGALVFGPQNSYAYHTNGAPTGIYTIPFALFPESVDPSGSINMSRVDNTDLQVTVNSFTAGSIFHCFALNHNILKIFSGLSGIGWAS